MNPDRKRILIVLAIVVAIAAVYFLALRTPPLTAERLIEDAHQVCLDFGHTEAECEGTN